MLQACSARIFSLITYKTPHADRLCQVVDNTHYKPENGHLKQIADVATDLCRFVELLEDAADPGMFGQQFFFSYGTDITLTQQRWASTYEGSKAGRQPLWANADKRFWWNRFLTQPLIGNSHT